MEYIKTYRFLANFVEMSRRVFILFILLIGLLAGSNKASACKNHPNKPSKATISCKNEGGHFGHDCNKKCKNHQCDCSTISSFSFLNKSLHAELMVLTYPTQKCFSLYTSSFYNEVYISIWHPPKIV